MIVKLQRELRPYPDRTFLMTDESGEVRIQDEMTDEVLTLLGGKNKVYVEITPGFDGKMVARVVDSKERW